MELCFVSGGVREFVEEQVEERPEVFGRVPQTGARVVDSTGTELGTGAPYYRYTVGQRRDLGVESNQRLYVLGVSPEENEIVVGASDDLFSDGLVAERVHWIGPPPDGEIEAEVKIRARHEGVACRIVPGSGSRGSGSRGSGGRVAVDFAAPQRGVAPGQAAVFYRGSQVLGGGWICRPD